MVIKKCVILPEVALKENIHPKKVISVGDGTNDLIMLSNISLGIAFNAKRHLREHSVGSRFLPNLEELLYFLGISRHEVNAFFQREHIK